MLLLWLLKNLSAFLKMFCLLGFRSPYHMWKFSICVSLRLVGLSDVFSGRHAHVHHYLWYTIW